MDETNLTLIVMPGPSSGAVLSLKISPISGVSKAGCVFAQVQHHPNPPGVPTTPGDDRRSRYFLVTTSPALPISGNQIALQIINQKFTFFVHVYNLQHLQKCLCPNS